MHHSGAHHKSDRLPTGITVLFAPEYAEEVMKPSRMRSPEVRERADQVIRLPRRLMGPVPGRHT